MAPSHALVPLTYLVGDSPNHALPQQYVDHALRTGCFLTVICLLNPKSSWDHNMQSESNMAMWAPAES